MRKTTALIALFFTFLLASATASAQRTHVRRATTRTVARSLPAIAVDTAVIVEEPIAPVPADDIINESVDKQWPWPKCEATEKINAANRCEAYPWISADGLRLYFTSNRDGGHGNIYFTERSSVNDPFTKVQKMFPGKENRYYSASLTSDELTMIITLEGYTLYIAERKSISEPFGTPRILPEFKDKRFYGPSISADGKEMMAIDYNSETPDKAKPITVLFEKDANGRFVEKARLEMPGNKTPGPGQLGKDGLTYYCSISEGYGQAEKLYCFTRTAPGAPFTFSHPLPHEVNVSRGSLQPSVNSDATVLAYVINNDGGWGGDDIRVINLTTPLKEDRSGNEPPAEPLLVAVKPVTVAETIKATPAAIKISPIDISHVVLPAELKTNKVEPEAIVRTSAVSVYPNPFKEVLTVEFAKPTGGKLLFELYDVHGQRVLSQQIAGGVSVVPIKTGVLPAGQFTCRISGSEGLLYSGTVISGK